MLSRSYATSASRAANLMKGILVKEFGGPEQCKLVHDLPVPEPNDDQIQIRVNSFGINPIDTYIRTGTHQRKPKLPYIPGFDCAGVVAKLGKNVKDFKVGDRVFTVDSDSGTYADYTLSKSRSVFCLPSNLNFYEGSALGVPFFTAYKSLVLTAKSKPGETVLVHGASGATGTACVQLAKAFGLRVIGTAGTKEGLELVRKQGADDVFNHREPDYTDKLEQAYPEGLDIILEMNGQTNLNKDLELLKHRKGRIVVIGCRGPVEINPRLLMAKDTFISGVLVFNSTEEEFRMMNAGLQSLIKLNCAKPVIAKVYQIENTCQAHRDLTYNTKLGRLTVHVN